MFLKYTCLALRSLVVAIALLTSACTGGTASTGAPVTPAAMAGATATTEALGATAPPAALPSTPTELPVAATSPPPTEPASTDTPAPPALAPATPTIAPPASSAGTLDEGVDQIVGTVVRFSARSTSVDVTIGEDNPAVRDFLSRLPLTLTLEDLVGREKIAYLSPELAHAGSPGSDPEDGDLIYYVTWGNLGFYYNAAGIDYSDQTIHFGTYDASLEQLEQLEGPGVIVEVVR